MEKFCSVFVGGFGALLTGTRKFAGTPVLLMPLRWFTSRSCAGMKLGPLIRSELENALGPNTPVRQLNNLACTVVRPGPVPLGSVVDCPVGVAGACENSPSCG